MEENKTQVTRIPLIGDIAPSFTAQTTHGEVNFPEDYKDSWIVLFSHPGDFTPVCTTEFLGFQELKGQFDKRNTKLLGYSADGIHSHIAWLRNIKEKFDVDIEFPVASGFHIAQKYGMIHPNAEKMATVRAVFIINPEAEIAALMYYPLSNGRNIFEILRAVDSLQMTYQNNRLTPANWPHNRIFKDKVIVPPENTLKDAYKTEKNNPKSEDWYIISEEKPD